MDLVPQQDQPGCYDRAAKYREERDAEQAERLVAGRRGRTR
jgi:hypothetical protein